MPCGGPSQEVAYRQGERAFEEIMELLVKKYYISKDLHAAYEALPIGFMKDGAIEYDKAKETLKKAIQELIWIDDCYTW